MSKISKKTQINDNGLCFVIGDTDYMAVATLALSNSIKVLYPNATIKYTSKLIDNSYSTASTSRKNATPFSLLRAFIPTFNDFTNFDYVIYQDCDQLLLKRIDDELQAMSQLGIGFAKCKFVFPSDQSSVLIWNLANFDRFNYLETLKRVDVKQHVDRLILELGVKTMLPDTLNHLDWVDETTKIFHCTYMPSQPWNKPKLPISRWYWKYVFYELNLLNDTYFLEVLKNSIEKGTVSAELLDDYTYLREQSIRHPSIFIPPYYLYHPKLRLFVNIFRKIGQFFCLRKENNGR